MDDIQISPVAVTQVYEPAVTTGDMEGSMPLTHSVSDLFALVKQYDKEFSPKPVNEHVLNDDGTPKVFYHGTNAAWTQYDLSKNVNQIEGIYLTADPKRARLYGDRVMPLHVKATTDFREAKKTGRPRDYTYVKATGDIVVVSPEQIKSASTGAMLTSAPSTPPIPTSVLPSPIV